MNKFSKQKLNVFLFPVSSCWSRSFNDTLCLCVSAHCWNFIITPPPIGGRNIAMSVSVSDCLSVCVCLSVPKQIFFGQLATGKRPQCGPVRRFKDVIKSHMQWCEINAADLCSASLNRTSWRTLCHKAAAKFEDTRISALERRRAVRKFGAQPLNNPGAWPCSSCSRICNSRIGLYTHERTHR